MRAFVFIILSLTLIESNARAQSRSAADDAPLILITYFDPFDGAKVNNSKVVAVELKKELDQTFQVETCEVPTIYDQDMEVAKQCLEKLPRKPDLILSLGEGSPCQQVNLETVTFNLDADGEDNANINRTHHVIIPNEPAKKALHFFDFKVKRILRNIPEIKRSKNIGNFVCNNLAFHMTTYLENYTRPTIPFAFLHVPAHTCRNSGLSPTQSAASIRNLLVQLSR